MRFTQDMTLREVTDEALTIVQSFSTTIAPLRRGPGEMELAQQLLWVAHLRAVRLGHEMRGELALAQMAANTLRKAGDHADKLRAAIERSERGLAVTP